MVHHAAASSSGADRRNKLLARSLGSTISGLLELAAFHPVDTVAKRLMSSTQPVLVPGRPMRANLAVASSVIFRDAKDAPFFRRYASLFPGLSFAVGYKVLQRVYRFGGQATVNDWIASRFQPAYERRLGPKHARAGVQATAGAVIGLGEIVLLPLDTLKIKAQTDPETIRGRGLLEMLSKEWRGLYRGAGWTAARNVPGSFALFGGNAWMKDRVFQLEDPKQATLLQTLASSSVGASLSVAVSNPVDVVKTRIQNRPFDSPESGRTIVRNMLRNEGMGAFMKGFTPKLLMVGPKLVFSFTVAQQLIALFEEALR